MTDLDLISRLKTVPVPERSDEYWNDFPSRIRVQLRRESHGYSSHKPWRMRLAWAGGFAAGVALTLACVGLHVPQAVSHAIARQRGVFHAQAARLDTGLHKLILNTDGMGSLLTEPN
jgi:hypothetical protein